MSARKSVGVRELRQNLSVYLRQVEAGETLEGTRRGRPAAVLGRPPASARRRAKASGVLYMDASALVKLVLPEPESGALVAALAGGPELITSTVGAIETGRAILAAAGDDELTEEGARVPPAAAAPPLRGAAGAGGLGVRPPGPLP